MPNGRRTQSKAMVHRQSYCCQSAQSIRFLVLVSSCCLVLLEGRLLSKPWWMVQGDHFPKRRLRPTSVFADAQLRSSNSSRVEGIDTDVRIVGGTAVPDAAMFPTYAFTAGRELCGATFIHPDILLTAAHCEGAFVDGILHGGLDINGRGSSFIPVDEEFAHPEYSEATDANDIMLVKLTSPTSAPLQELNFDPSFPADGATTTVIGFGRTSEDGDISSVLLQVDVNTVTHEFCNSLFGKIIEEIMLCAGGDGQRDSCQGDSGGPLFSQDGRQIGIVSFGSGCARAETPAVYARVSGYESWIRQGICDLSNDPPGDCVASTIAPSIAPTPPPTLAAMDLTDEPTIGQVDTPGPTETPSLRPSTVQPTVGATASPTTVSPTVQATVSPTISITQTPTTLSPSTSPTTSPTTTADTQSPTLQTAPPTIRPTFVPSATPSSAAPTESPTAGPTMAPQTFPVTIPPTDPPTLLPTLRPVVSTSAPTRSPQTFPVTIPPTVSPTLSPTTTPTLRPVVSTSAPTRAPQTFPVTTPPTDAPSPQPTLRPVLTINPPTIQTSARPSAMPKFSQTTGLPTPKTFPATPQTPSVGPPPAQTPLFGPTRQPQFATATMSPTSRTIGEYVSSDRPPPSRPVHSQPISLPTVPTQLPTIALRNKPTLLVSTKPQPAPTLQIPYPGSHAIADRYKVNDYSGKSSKKGEKKSGKGKGKKEKSKGKGKSESKEKSHGKGKAKKSEKGKGHHYVHHKKTAKISYH